MICNTCCDSKLVGVPNNFGAYTLCPDCSDRKEITKMKATQEAFEIDLDLGMEKITPFGKSERLLLIEFYDGHKMMLLDFNSKYVILETKPVLHRQKVDGPKKAVYNSTSYRYGKVMQAPSPAGCEDLDFESFMGWA